MGTSDEDVSSGEIGDSDYFSSPSSSGGDGGSHASGDVSANKQQTSSFYPPLMASTDDRDFESYLLKQIISKVLGYYTKEKIPAKAYFDLGESLDYAVSLS